MLFAYIQTVIIILLLVVIMIGLSKVALKKNDFKFVTISIALYSIVFGQRYMLGVDFISYDYVYNELLQYGNSELVSRWELGFRIYAKFLSNLQASPILFFGIIAFLQLFLILYTFKKNIELIPFIIFTFMIGCSWLTFSNGLRHILAVSIWILAVKFAVDGEVKKHYITIFIASLIHKSSLLLLVFYPLIRLKQSWFNKIGIQLCIYVISILIIQSGVLTNILSFVDDASLLLGYDSYMDRVVEQSGRQVSLGIGFIVISVLNIVIITYSNKMKSFYDDKYISTLYDLFYIGIILKNIFMPSQVLSRINYYFSNLSFVIGGVMLCYLYTSNNRFRKILVTLYFCLLIATIYNAENNTSLFVFRWQEDLYHVKSTILNNISL